MKNYQNSALECEPYLSKDRIIFIKNIYKVAQENMILFRLSNGFIQVHEYEKNLHLLIADEDVVMLELEKDHEVSRHVEKKENYAKFPTGMLKIYLRVKKILNILKNRH